MPEQAEQHKYIYCVIDMRDNESFTPFAAPGDGKAQVQAIRHGDMAAVVAPSSCGEDSYQITRETTVGHAKVIEQVMKEHTALPVRFGTVAKSDDALREQVLSRRYGELRELMGQMANKDEMGVKVFWRDMDAVFQEVVAESAQIRRGRDALAPKIPEATYYDRIELGKLVEAALDAKRDQQGEAIARDLAQAAEDFRVNPVRTDRMVLNSSYLVHRERMKEFDEMVSDLAARHEQALKVKYVGPVAPFNFVTLVITWDEEGQEKIA